MGNPVHGVTVKRTQVQPSKKLSALTAMANLGTVISKSVADSQETQSIIDAQNDVVNEAINPDKMKNQAAYAFTVAENDALKMYNDTSEAIQSGKYDEIDPSEFQKTLKQGHQEYYKKWESNDHAEGAITAYNQFMLKNQARITAAQAGKYRLDQKDKQGTALSTRISDMAGSGLNTLEDFQAEIESDKYSLLSADDRLRTVLTGAGNKAKETGKVDLLEALDKEYGLSADPKLNAQFEGIMTAANRKRTAISDAAILKQLTVLDAFVEAGTLTENMYEPVSILKDSSGNPIVSPNQFNALLRKSNVERAKKQAQAQYVVKFNEGIDLNSVKTSDFDTIANAQFQNLVGATGDTVTAYRKMGELLAQQTHVWTDLQDRAKMFDRTVMVMDNAPNKEAMKRFYELEGLEAGMETYTDGANLFSKYLGDSYADYLEIKLALQRTSDTPEAAWMDVATSRTLVDRTSKKKAVMSKLSTAGKDVGLQAAKDVFQRSNKWYIPDFIENATSPTDPVSRVSSVAAIEYDQKIAEGRSPEIAKLVALRAAHRQVEKWGGELFDTHGIGMKALMQTTDTNGAFDTLIEDPEFGAKLKSMFGLTTREIWFGKQEDNPIVPNFIERVFDKVDEPVTPEEIRAANKERSGKTLHLTPGAINKNVNVERGTLDFESDDGEVMYSIPLKTIGAMQNAKLQGVEDLANLDRLYSASFLSTDAGRLWHDQQADANDVFANEILGTAKASGRTDISPEDYSTLSQKDKTMVRKQFYKNVYSGAMGTAARIADFFNLKRDILSGSEESFIHMPVSTPEVAGVKFEVNTAKDWIKRHEGLSLEKYEDGDGQTIGFGHQILPGEKLDTVTRDQADMLFERDFPKYLRAASRIPGFESSTSNRQMALVDLTYNMGTSWYKNFPRFSKAYAAGDYQKAAQELMDSEWYPKVKSRGPEIIRMILEG